MGCDESKARSNEPIGTLHYFDLYGRGEMIRLLLNHANVNFVDHRVAMADWPAIKPTMKGGQMPIWEQAGVQYNDSIPIMRYFGKTYGYVVPDAGIAYETDCCLNTDAGFLGKVAPLCMQGKNDAEGK